MEIKKEMKTIKCGKELFKILYKDNKYILVESTNNDSKYGYGPYSFGLIEDFNSLYFLPVNQSFLHKEELINKLKKCIEIDKKYLKDYPYSADTIKVWENMLKEVNYE